MRLVRLCGVNELPREGELRQFPCEGRHLCVANDRGWFRAVDNVCPHRQGPLAEGFLENGKVLCPWHAWAFDLTTGEAEHESGERVEVFQLRIRDGDVLASFPD